MSTGASRRDGGGRSSSRGNNNNGSGSGGRGGGNAGNHNHNANRGGRNTRRGPGRPKGSRGTDEPTSSNNGTHIARDEVRLCH